MNIHIVAHTSVFVLTVLVLLPLQAFAADSILFFNTACINQNNNDRPLELCVIDEIGNRSQGVLTFFDSLNQEITNNYNKRMLDHTEYTKKQSDLNKIRDDFNQKINNAQNKFWQNEPHIKVRQKLKAINASIAKRRNAYAVLEYTNYDTDCYYVDPTHDITREAVDMLNKDYIAAGRPLPQGSELYPVLTENRKKEIRDSIFGKKSNNPQDMLHDAILADSPEEIKQAVLAGANINLEDKGKTPILSAVLHKKPKAVESLLGHGAKADASLILHAISSGSIKCAVLISKKHGLDINTKHSGCTLLQHAFMKGDLDSIQVATQLIKDGADISGNVYVNYAERSIADCIIGTANLDLIQMLINRGYNINDSWRVANYQNEELIKFLVKNGGNPNHVIIDPGFNLRFGSGSGSWTPLLFAAYHGDVKAVKVLLENGANVHQKACPNLNYTNCTVKGTQSPLSIAMGVNKTNVVELLLEYGATS